jgi:putative endonuclease
MKDNPKGNGEAAERLAEQYLSKAGLRLVTRNFRCRMGEIDLIMKDRDSLVFVEVRLRSSRGFGGAAASIGSHKQRRLIAAAQYYLAGLSSTPACRFDAVLLDGLNAERIEWLKNAFDA